MLDHSSEQLRQIAHNLMPGELVKFGLVPAVNMLISQLAETENNAQFYTHAMDDRLEPTKEIHIFRIIQEIVQNVIKHADASNLDISITKHTQFVNILIEDDGKGYDAEKVSTGMGLTNIKSRITMLHGKLQINSEARKGTTFDISTPTS
ncbi:MAG: ATP-binding protein [Leeuwenhoekiella sp.]